MKLASNLFSQSQYDSNNDSSIVNEKESVATTQIDSQMESKQTTQTNCEEINDMFMTSNTLIVVDEDPTKKYAFRNLNFTNTIDFNYEIFIETKSILLFRPYILANINNVSLKATEYRLVSHSYMYLQRQDRLACWHHSLSAVLGFSIHPFIREGNWLTGALISFATVPAEHFRKLDTEGNASFNGTELLTIKERNFDIIPAVPQKLEGFDNLRSNVLAYKCMLLCDSYVEVGMPKVIFYI